MNIIKKLLLGASIPLAFAGVAFGHATSIGYANSGPGSVTIWLGTYGHGGHHLEGSMTLTGVNGTVYGPTTNPFTILTSTGAAFKPAGLIDGVTNFFAPAIASGGSHDPNNPPLVGVDPVLYGGVDHWQGAVFTGLSAGDYQFNWTPIVNPTAEWSLLNTNMNGIFTLGASVVNPPSNGVPDGGSSLLLLGAALAGVGALRSRRRR